MPSSYSSNLKIELIANGEQDGTWGSTTNTNLGTALEQAITGSGTVTFASGDVTLGFASSNAAQDFRNIRLRLTGTTAGPRNLIVPTIQKIYFIDNQTADTITVKTSAGTGVAVPTGARSVMFANGVNVVEGLSHFNSLTAVSPAFSGTPTAPTASPGTNTTQIATTAFVGAATTALNLGTIATQNANNVNITGGSVTGVTLSSSSATITGGSISGITDLAVADGGTGSSSITANSIVLGNGTGALNGNLVAPGTNGNVLTSNGTTWASSTNLAIGVGQTWQDVSGSRSFGTTYTNSTGKPIQIFVGLSGGAGGTFNYTVQINGATIINTTTDFGATVSLIIPNSNTYRVTSTDALASWWELR